MNLDQLLIGSIPDGSLVNKKLSANSVDSRVLADDAVNNGKILNESVTEDKLDPDILTDVRGSQESNSNRITAVEGRVGDLEEDDTGWIELNLLNGWERYSASWAPQYRRVGKLVKFRGLLRNSNVDSSYICDLPSDHYLGSTLIIGCTNQYLDNIRINVNNNGIFYHSNHVANAWFSLEAVTYYLDN